MALKRKFDKLEDENTLCVDFEEAYYYPVGFSINLKRQEVTVNLGVKASEEARKEFEDADFIHKEKHTFKFKEFGLTRKKLFDSAYKCLKKLDKFKDAEDI
jgi:hypothetical protein